MTHVFHLMSDSILVISCVMEIDHMHFVKHRRYNWSEKLSLPSDGSH